MNQERRVYEYQGDNVNCHRKEIQKLSNIFINSGNKTKLSCNTPHRRSTTVSLETYPLYSLPLRSNYE